MSEKRLEGLDAAALDELLNRGEINGVLVAVCAFAETRRSRSEAVIPDGSAGEAVRALLDRIYSICISLKLHEEYALLYEATRYVPHGSLIQPMLDHVMRTYHQRVAEVGREGLSESERDVLRIFIDLSLEAFDKLGSFRVFLSEFREYIPFASLPKALTIATRLGDEHAIAELTSSLLHPPLEQQGGG